MATLNTNSSEMFRRLGGEIKRTAQRPVVTGGQPYLKARDLGSDFTTLTEPGSIAGLPSAKFDVAVAFFERKGIPRSIARTYGLAILEAALNSGRDVTDLINIGDKPDVKTLSDDALTYINLSRGKTSQIGFKSPGVPIDNNLSRTVIV